MANITASSQSKTMRALVHETPGVPMTVKDIPFPSALQGTAIVKVLAAQVDSNLPLILRGEIPFPNPVPFTPGARSVGRVVAVGPDATSLKPGQLVMIEPFIHARDDTDNKGLFGAFSGANEDTQRMFNENYRHAAYAEYVRAPLENTWPLDEKVFCDKMGHSFAELTQLTVYAVAYGGLRAIGLQAGETIIVAPATGQYSGVAIGLATAMGANVIAASRNLPMLQSMQQLYGPEHVKIVQITNDVEVDTAALRAQGEADAYIDLSPASAASSTHVRSCAKSLRDNGRICLMGGLPNDLSITYWDILMKGLTIKGQYMYRPEDVKALLKLAESGRLKLGAAANQKVIATFKLDDIEEAFATVTEHSKYGELTILDPWLA